MNEIVKFTHEKFGEIRTVEIDNEPWFVGKDIAISLGYVDTVNALKSHVAEEDKRGWQITTSSGTQQMTVINESGMYSMIMSSKLQSAREFKHWVTHDVLPSIRKNGGYISGQDELAEEAFFAKALKVAENILARREKRIRELEVENALQDQVIADFQPVKRYVDEILSSTDSVTITQIANDYGLSAKQLNRILKEEKVQYKVNGQWVLYKQYRGKKYTDSVTYLFEHKNGEKGTKMFTRWTQSGRLLIHGILERRGIIALMDR